MDRLLEYDLERQQSTPPDSAEVTPGDTGVTATPTQGGTRAASLDLAGHQQNHYHQQQQHQQPLVEQGEQESHRAGDAGVKSGPAALTGSTAIARGSHDAADGGEHAHHIHSHQQQQEQPSATAGAGVAAGAAAKPPQHRYCRECADMMEEMCPGLVGAAGAAAAGGGGPGSSHNHQQQQQQDTVSEARVKQRQQQQQQEEDPGVSECGSVHYSEGGASVASSAYTSHSHHHHHHHLSAHQSLKDMKDKISSLKAILLHEPRCEVCGRPIGSGGSLGQEAAAVGAAAAAGTAAAAGKTGAAAAGEHGAGEDGLAASDSRGGVTSPTGLERVVTAKVQGKKLLEAITGALAVPLKHGGEGEHPEGEHHGVVEAGEGHPVGGARWYNGTEPHVAEADGRAGHKVHGKEQEGGGHGQQQQQQRGRSAEHVVSDRGSETGASARAPAGEALEAAEFDAAAPANFDAAAAGGDAGGGDPSLGEKWRSMMVALKAAGHQLPSFSGSLLEAHAEGGVHDGTWALDGQVSMVKQMWDSWAPKLSSPTSQGGSHHALHLPQVGALVEKAPAIASLFRRPSKGLGLLPTNSTGGYQSNGSSAGAGHGVLGVGGAVSSSSIIVSSSSGHQQQHQQEGSSLRRGGTRLGGLPPMGSGGVTSPTSGHRQVLNFTNGYNQQQQVQGEQPYPGSPPTAAAAAARPDLGADGGVTGLCPPTPPQRGLASPFSTPQSSFHNASMASAQAAAAAVASVGRGKEGLAGSSWLIMEGNGDACVDHSYELAFLHLCVVERGHIYALDVLPMSSV